MYFIQTSGRFECSIFNLIWKIHLDVQPTLAGQFIIFDALPCPAMPLSFPIRPTHVPSRPVLSCPVLT